MVEHINKSFRLINQHNMQVEVCNYGARILSIKVANNQGELIETTQNHYNIAHILNDDAFMGATVGRVCNRISGAQFAIDGTCFKLQANEGENLLHGGEDGFDKRVWNTEGVKANNTSIRFTLVSVDGDQGFPGELTVSVDYQLTDNNELIIKYQAITTKATPINLCNHAYFHLGERHIRDLNIQINADEYLPVNAQSIPLGSFCSVTGTKFDLQTMSDLNDKLDSDGYDHCYKIKQAVCARVESKNTRICLEVETDHLGLQFYTGNFLPNKQSALCLEAQGYPDAINHDTLEHDILRPKETYKRTVIYRFSHASDLLAH